MGRYEDAVRELEKAVELKPGDPIINDHLGDAYWKVGRKLEAKFQWDHAKDSNPEHEDLVKILKKIDNGLEEDQAGAAENAPAPSRKRRSRRLIDLSSASHVMAGLVPAIFSELRPRALTRSGASKDA